MSPSFSKSGDNLEFLSAAYFQAQGYLVRRGVMLSVAAGTADATDIDLVAIRFSVPLTEERIIADCKDRRKPRPFERILWTRGLASFAHATQAIVILPKALWQAREFAAQGKVDVLEELEIDKYLRGLDSSFHPYGDADPKLSHLRKQNGDKQLARRSLELRQMLVTGHPLTNLNRIIQILSNLGKAALTNEGQSAWMRRYVCLDAAVIAGVMLVRFAAESKWTPEKDWSAYARKKLTFGDVSPQKALQLAELALDRRISEGIPAPAYTGEILELIKALITNPKVAAHVPTSLDYYLFGASRVGLRTGSVDEHALKLSRRVLSALSYAAGITGTLWQLDVAQKELAYPESHPSSASRGDQKVVAPTRQEVISENSGAKSAFEPSNQDAEQHKTSIAGIEN